VLEECATKREERAALEQQVAALEAELEAGRAQELHWPCTAARASQPLALLHRYTRISTISDRFYEEVNANTVQITISNGARDRSSSFLSSFHLNDSLLLLFQFFNVCPSFYN
jgi:hypothetical protein